MPDNDNTQDDTRDDTSSGPIDGAAAAPPPESGADSSVPTNDDVPEPESPAPKKAAAKKTAKKAAKKTAKKTAAKKTAKAADVAGDAEDTPDEGVAGVTAAPDAADAPDAPGGQVAAPVKKAAKRTAKKSAARKGAASAAVDSDAAGEAPSGDDDGTAAQDATETDASEAAASGAPAVLFKAPAKPTTTTRKRSSSRRQSAEDDATEKSDDTPEVTDGSEGRDGSAGSDGAGSDEADEADGSDDEGSDSDSGNRRRRRRGGRRRRKPGGGNDGNDGDDNGDSSDDDGSSSNDSSSSKGGKDSGEDDSDSSGDSSDSGDSGQGGEGSGSRRRRRRRRPEDGDEDSGSTPRARKPRNPEDEITSIGGSTRLEAKKQRRREGREAGRRRAPIVSEAEFLARRESVDRVMVIRQREDLTQIAVLEDKVLVEHYVARESQTSLIGNVYLGRVQNVLPSMEAAFIDIGKGRNAVLYAGEVNWSALGHKDGQPRKVESVLSSGQTILVQVTKDPVGHKGSRLTGQVSLPGRFLVYVPEGNTSGISRKLPDTERNRLKTLLKEIVPNTAGVIVRTAAEGASEEELTLDVERLTARWSDIEEKVKAGKGPQLLYGEPDLTLKVVRDLFTEDFTRLVIQGEEAWNLVDDYVAHVAPDLRDRLERFGAADGDNGGNGDGGDVFASYRVDEQIAKGVDRKVWLPSGGSLVIDRTEAMTVVDVNTGKFTGSGGNLEETVTKNNLEAAEEIVRQLRLRDIGGIIVVDFIDMVLESNRDLVLRRLVECLGRDRTRHQVAEVTSLGLVQMTRKRIGTGLIEAFSTECEHCKGRGLVVHDHPVEHNGRAEDDEPRGRRARGGRNSGRRSGSSNGDSGGNGGNGGNGGSGGNGHAPSPADLAASRPPQKSADEANQDGNQDGNPDDSQVEDQADVQVERATEQAVEQAPEPSQEPAQESADTAEPHGVGTPAATDAEPIDVPTQTGSAEPEQDAPRSEPAEPAAPRVVTRRRSARRPAGPPAATEETSIPGAGTQAGPAAEPVAVPVDPGPDSDLVDPDAAAEDEESVDSNGFSLMHVPIKRKGRKR